VGSCHHCLGRAEAALEAAVKCPEGTIRPDDRSRGLSESLPAMSQSDFPEHFPFALDASFLPCASGLVCPDPGKMPEAARFPLIPLVYLGSQGVQFNYPQRQRAGIALSMTP